MKLIVLLVFIISSCGKEEASTTTPTNAYRETRSITYNNITLKVVIDKPAQDEVDVLLVFHGTILYDSGILQAANNTLDNFKRILDRKDMMIVSVAYPGENMLLGDNIVHVEAALLWVKYQANQELGITVKKIFLGGHSQGGYLVARLNTMHQTNGVIANAPGPLNLIYRCQLEEDGNLPTGVFCNNLKNVYGTPSSNPDAYHQRSLLHFTKEHKSDILFVQGLNDTPIQMHTWPKFKKDVMDCTNCQNSQFLEIVGGEHASLFASAVAKTEFNKFINSR